VRRKWSKIQHRQEEKLSYSSSSREEGRNEKENKNKKKILNQYRAKKLLCNFELLQKKSEPCYNINGLSYTDRMWRFLLPHLNEACLWKEIVEEHNLINSQEEQKMLQQQQHKQMKLYLYFSLHESQKSESVNIMRD